MTRHLSFLAATAFATVASQASAQTGDIVMRRPIPKAMAGAGGGDPVQSEPDTVPASPEETVCDAGSATGAKLTAVKWVEGGWSDGGMNAESCAVQKMTYTCQATYTCAVGGREQSFVSDAPDSVCEGEKGEVGYPGDTPDPTKFPKDRSVADQVAWFMAKADNLVRQQQSGGAPVTTQEIIRTIPWVRGADQIKWWTPGEYSPSGHMNYIRIFIDPGGSGLYDANTEICGQMRAMGHPCSNYYSHEGGSVFVAWILG